MALDDILFSEGDKQNFIVEVLVVSTGRLSDICYPNAGTALVLELPKSRRTNRVVGAGIESGFRPKG